MADTENYGKNYVLGKGRIYFDQFAPGTLDRTAELYFGNTPSFTTTQAVETLDHYDADEGIRQKDDSVDTSNTQTGALTTDNISSANLSKFFLGSSDNLVIAPGAGETQNLVAVLGGSYQLGTSDAVPQGFGNLQNVSLKKGNAVIDPANYDVDLATGRITLHANAAGIAANDALVATYDAVGGSISRVISGTTSIFGALRFVATNPKGLKRDYYARYVKLTPNGDFALKGDDWQTIGFNVEFLKHPSAPRLIITGR